MQAGSDPRGPIGKGAAPPPRHQMEELCKRVGLIFVAALLLSLPMPAIVFPAALSSFLFYAAVGTMLMALWRSEPAFPHRCLNRWDSAAVLLLCSLLAGLAVDASAVDAYFREQLGAPAGTHQ
ncbi:MAG: hypothetical protein AB7O49_15435 [Sphingomonadales bacterium]